ncbi:MAG: ABC transporter permease, partial [Acidobacteriota bacterium]|nr:ABC transporter permease [Acidobacteriota bacterium]
MNYRRTRAVFVKELNHIVRDRLSLALALAIPVMMLLLFGYALSLDVERIPTLIYDQDGTPASRELARQFHGSRYFEIRGFASDYAAIERDIDRGRILTGIVIPIGFGGDIAAGKGASVQLLMDGSDSNTSAIARGYAESIVRKYSAQIQVRGGTVQRSAPAVDAQIRVWYNSSLRSRNYVVPGLIAVILMTMAGQLTSLTIAREWEMGTMEQLLSTPLRPSELVAGKMFAYFIVGLADAIIVLVIGVGVFSVPFRGSALLLGASTCLFLCVVLFWGILISSATRNQIMAFQLGMLTTFLPGFLLSGFMFSIDTMPAPLQAISRIVPARYFVVIL